MLSLQEEHYRTIGSEHEKYYEYYKTIMEKIVDNEKEIGYSEADLKRQTSARCEEHRALKKKHDDLVNKYGSAVWVVGAYKCQDEYFHIN